MYNQYPSGDMNRPTWNSNNRNDGRAQASNPPTQNGRAAAQSGAGQNWGRPSVPPRPVCSTCGSADHATANCSLQQQTLMMSGSDGAAAASRDNPIGTQRPSGRVVFNVQRQSVQRPSRPQTPTAKKSSTGPSNIFKEANITLPMSVFTQLPGVADRLQSYLKPGRTAVALAEEGPGDLNDGENASVQCHTLRLEDTAFLNGRGSRGLWWIPVIIINGLHWLYYGERSDG